MSNAGQGDDQSLEDILSSIRKKISANPDMSVPAPGATADQSGETPRLGEPVVKTPGPALSASAARPSPFSDSLSDMLGRADAGAALDEAAAAAAEEEDNLSDLLDDPLPNPLDQSGSWSAKPTLEKDENASATVTKLSPGGPGTQGSNGTRGSSTSAKDIGTPAPGAPEKVSSGSDITAAAASAATLKAVSSQPLTKEQATRPGAASQPASRGPGTGTPRSMSVLSSGFSMPGTDASDDAGATPPTSRLPSAKSTASSEPVSLSATASRPKPSSSLGEMGAPQSPTSSASFPMSSAGTLTSASGAPAGVLRRSKSLEDTVSEMLRPMLEEKLTEMLRPMLREWLEANMPRIVENALRIEVLETSNENDAKPKG